jgi:spore coat protein U-like protein
MHVKPFLYILGWVLAVLLIAPCPAAAIGSCSFDSTVGVNFGTYDVFNTIPTDSTGSMTYTCVSLVGTITIDLSKGSALSYGPRQMRQGTGTMTYNLYLDAARVLVWGDGTGGTSRYGPVVPLLALPVTVTIYSRIPARQNVTAGSYTDTIMATINF